MKYLISGIFIVLFLVFFTYKLYIYSFIFIILLITYVFYINKEKRENNSVFDSKRIKPLSNEQDINENGYVYTLNDTHLLQKNIKDVVGFDNNNSLVSREFDGLSDEEILTFETNELKRFYQYKDDFGIRDYIFGELDKKTGLQILAKNEKEYVVVGYLNYDDAMYFITNKSKLSSHRLIYQGGRYKHVGLKNMGQKELLETVEDYILRLVVFYTK